MVLSYIIKLWSIWKTTILFDQQLKEHGLLEEINKTWKKNRHSVSWINWSYKFWWLDKRQEFEVLVLSFQCDFSIVFFRWYRTRARPTPWSVSCWTVRTNSIWVRRSANLRNSRLAWTHRWESRGLFWFVVNLINWSSGGTNFVWVEIMQQSQGWFWF